MMFSLFSFFIVPINCVLDVLRFLRYVQVDIDDVFVGQSGTKISSADVYRLIEVQHDLRNYIENFTFFLGFSGYFFRHGDAADIKGDEALVGTDLIILFLRWVIRFSKSFELSLVSSHVET